MTNFELLHSEIKSGMEGRNEGFSTGFHRLNKYVSIRKKILTLIFGGTGTGKSAFTHDMFILNPFEYYHQNKANLGGRRMKVILFSMERSKVYTISKWLVRKIFKDTGREIAIGKLLGWWDTKLSFEEHDLILMYEDYINELTEDFVTVYEGAQNPTGIYKILKEYADKNGRIEEISKYKKVYIPNNPDEIVVPIIDHSGLTRIERGFSYKKEAIDKLSEYLQSFRDFEGYSPVVVSQLNRDMNAMMSSKITNLEPTLDSVKETGNIGEACDIALSLFDPLRYRTTDAHYDVSKFIDPNSGGNYFRSLKIQKNTYGVDSVGIGMAFMGSIGSFVELPKSKDMDMFNYTKLFNGTYFMDK